MDLRQLFRSARTAREIELLASTLADQCRVAVRERIGPQVHEMDAHEVRGYVRARAGCVIRREASTSLAAWGQGQSLPEWAGRELVAQTTEAVVRLVMHDLMTDRIQPTLRRAA